MKSTGRSNTKSEESKTTPFGSDFKARPAGPIPSSTLGLEVMNGRLDDFGFEDYLNDPHGNLKPSGL
ncbi:hypothetical protein ACFX12_036089 [Malus domestica]